MRVGLRLPSDGKGGRVVVMDRGGTDIGWVDCEASDGWLHVRWIELGIEWRRHGLAAEAVQLLEAEASKRWGLRTARAEVPVGVGLALYFWLRLGYRPEEPVRREADTLAMVRRLS
jgi:hypothetical protein